jgi:hypothetical protein
LPISLINCRLFIEIDYYNNPIKHISPLVFQFLSDKLTAYNEKYKLFCKKIN